MALILLAACGGGGGGASDLPPPPRTTGPAGDYPMVLGPTYTVEGVSHTPADVMNYDAVGYAGVADGAGVSAAHRTLPLPSYVEVTSLDTGKTILVRVERRGPMTNSRLVDLSPAAAAQLGLTGGKVPVRVRRVNPPEPERALLRMGQAAPARMDTPQSLLGVLRRKLEGPGLPAPQPQPQPTATPSPAPTTTPPPTPPVAKPAPKGKIPRVAPEAPPAIERITPPPASPAGALMVQVGAFADRTRADAVAKRAGGQVSKGGTMWRVRMGPFASQAEAQAALAKAKAAGYSDARIQRAN